MLKDRLKLLFRVIGGTTRSVAEYAGITYSNIGKITNGSRIPKKKLSSTTPKLLKGIYDFSAANDKLDALCKTIACDPSLDENNIKKVLLDWLYEDTPQPESSDVVFHERLSEIQTIVGIGSVELARLSGLSMDTMKKISSSRAPSRNSKVLNNLSEVLLKLAEEKGVTDEVCAVMGITSNELSKMNPVPVFIDWLKGRTSANENYLISQFVNSFIDPIIIPRNLPEFEDVASEDILNDDNESYIGISGLQRAVIRFLGNAANKRTPELVLYSDQSMEWMQVSYTPKWLTLMRECLIKGVRIKIVHNLDRQPEEILFALKSWMPMYMTGLVESYYCTDTSGTRFSHSVFIGGDDCIEGFCTVGMEKDCIYHYTTDSKKTEHIKAYYNKMLSRAYPLITSENGLPVIRGNYKEYDCGKIKIHISTGNAVISKLTAPQMTFRFKHPYLLKIFSQYAQTFVRNDDC